MPPPSDAIAWYDANVASAVARFEAHDPAALNGWLQTLLPPAPAVIMDVGAGSGRDAAWLAARGHEVLAIEPSAALRAEAARLHPAENIRWLDDRLPDLTGPIRAGLSADAILLSAIWMHVRPDDRPRAFRKLVSLLRPGGLLAITLRDGPAEPGRGMHPVSLAEIEHLATDHGLAIVRVHHQPDLQGRPDLSWICVAMRLPDDGTGALPLLRHVILRDDKASTYKLGLLRSLCRIADGWAGMAREAEDGHATASCAGGMSPILSGRMRCRSASPRRRAPACPGSVASGRTCRRRRCSRPWDCSGSGCISTRACRNGRHRGARVPAGHHRSFSEYRMMPSPELRTARPVSGTPGSAERLGGRRPSFCPHIVRVWGSRHRAVEIILSGTDGNIRRRRRRRDYCREVAGSRPGRSPPQR